MKSKSKTTTRKPAAKAPAKAKAPRAARAPRRTDPARVLLQSIVAALEGKKAEDLRVLDVSQQSSITDYLVLANGNSEPHLRALRVELEKVLDAQRARILGMDTGKSSGWLVIDAFEVMIHLFTTENRDKYRMELLWKDATEVPVASLLK